MIINRSGIKLPNNIDDMIVSIFNQMDTDNNGTLDMQEFARFFEVLVNRDRSMTVR